MPSSSTTARRPCGSRSPGTSWWPIIRWALFLVSKSRLGPLFRAGLGPGCLGVGCGNGKPTAAGSLGGGVSGSTIPHLSRGPRSGGWMALVLYGCNSPTAGPRTHKWLGLALGRRKKVVEKLGPGSRILGVVPCSGLDGCRGGDHRGGGLKGVERGDEGLGGVGDGRGWGWLGGQRWVELAGEVDMSNTMGLSRNQRHLLQHGCRYRGLIMTIGAC